jgi:hypothetical protein
MAARYCEAWDCRCGKLGNVVDICSNCNIFRSRGRASYPSPCAGVGTDVIVIIAILLVATVAVWHVPWGILRGFDAMLPIAAWAALCALLVQGASKLGLLQSQNVNRQD